MLSTVKNILEKYVALKPETTMIVGFSGGWDSMCLLHIVKKLSETYGFNIVAAHLNHAWRGEESDDEEANAQRFCAEFDIKFRAERLDEDTKQTEAVAREERYEFFKRTYEYNKANILLTAHTKTDNAETVLYRIAKGTGLNGLEGIREFRKLGDMNIVRPLLSFSRKEIEAYCMENELFPNNDSSNQDTRFARNNIRYNIMPRLKEINPNVETSLINLAEIAIGNNNIIDELMQNIQTQITTGNKWHTQNFLRLNSAIRRHFVYNLLLKYNVEPSFSKVQEVLSFIADNNFSKTGKTLSITSDLTLFTSHKYTYMLNEEDTAKKNLREVIITGEGDFPFENKENLVIKPCAEKIEHFPPKSARFIYADMTNISFPLVLRTRRDGDIIQPLGMQGKMKLKKYFINKNIPVYQRDKMLLLCKENEVLWIAGIGMSEKLRVNEVATHKIELNTEI
ncbi:MAG: tRNA lysidine(34) synthetase TilS [Candidatus Gastranaerophilales bacterium]|nr:tRNA lysidine(34) synthetase TilS [Candidatus Gastranaerophilales bacterium]